MKKFTYYFLLFLLTLNNFASAQSPDSIHKFFFDSIENNKLLKTDTSFLDFPAGSVGTFCLYARKRPLPWGHAFVTYKSADGKYDFGLGLWPDGGKKDRPKLNPREFKEGFLCSGINRKQELILLKEYKELFIEEAHEYNVFFNNCVDYAAQVYEKVLGVDVNWNIALGTPIPLQTYRYIRKKKTHRFGRSLGLHSYYCIAKTHSFLNKILTNDFKKQCPGVVTIDESQWCEWEKRRKGFIRASCIVNSSTP